MNINSSFKGFIFYTQQLMCNARITIAIMEVHASGVIPPLNVNVLQVTVVTIVKKVSLFLKSVYITSVYCSPTKDCVSSGFPLEDCRKNRRFHFRLRNNKTRAPS